MPPQVTRAPRRAALLAALVLALVPAQSAAAHEGAGTISVDAAQRTGPLQVRYRVTLRYLADSHPKDDGAVTVTSTLGGSRTVPTRLRATDATEDGGYEGTVDFPSPGTWTVRFASVSPPVTMSIEQELLAQEVTTTTAPPTPAATATSAPVPTVPATEDSAGEAPAWLTALGLVGAAAAVVAAALWVRRRRRLRAR